MAKLYTKKGDEGKTSLVTGQMVKKSHLRLGAYGSLDELNSQLGVVRSLLSGHPTAWCEELDQELALIQSDCFTLGSRLACDEPIFLERLPGLSPDRIGQLERFIDAASSEAPPLKNFVLPGGHLVSSHLQLARCICRRAERECVRLDEVSKLESSTLIYLNRLSDFLFAAARLCNHRFGLPDEIWKA